MTGDQFSGVDDDLLADYVGGALAGTPEESEVAGRIADDPDWRAAFEELSRAMATVSAQLGTLAGPDEPMPADVAARIDAALAQAPGPLTVLSGGGTSLARPRRRPRWTAAAAAAAAVVVFAGIGTGLVTRRSSSSTDSATSSAAGSAESQAEPLMTLSVPLPPADRITSSDSDYEPGTLGRSGPRPATKNQRSPADVGEAADPLTRLRVSAALQACLDAIAAANRGGPLTVESVDYARYAGKPALIVVFAASNGRYAWASGPDCGASGVGADRLDAVPVG